MMYSNNKKAAQGVGTLIIFIALILVAAVAAAVLISTAANLQSSSFDVGSQAQERILTAAEVVQITVTDTGDGVINGTLDNFTVRLRLAAGSVPIKLEDLTISIDTANSSQVAIYDETTVSPSTFTVNTLTGTSGPGGYLVAGQLVDITIQANENILERQRVTFTILSTNGAPLPVSFLTPSVMIEQTTRLYP